MENEIIENLDSLNTENENINSENNESEFGEPDLEALKQQNLEINDKNRKLFARAKDGEEAKKFLKEQGFERKDNKWSKPEKPSEKKPSNESDYTEKIDKLTLKSEGITHSDDIKLVLDEAKRLQLSVDEVANMEHIKTKLKIVKEQREAESGMPSGSGKSGGNAKNSVEYWINKKNTDGSYDSPPDLELANKVIEARMKQESNNSKFSDEMWS